MTRRWRKPRKRAYERAFPGVERVIERVFCVFVCFFLFLTSLMGALVCVLY